MAKNDDHLWFHPQTGEPIPRDDKPASKATAAPQLTFSKLSGPAPLDLTVKFPGGADLSSAVIHWGDGSKDSKIDLHTTGEATHAYHNVGECTLKVAVTLGDGNIHTVEKLVKIKPAAPVKKADEATA